MQEVDAIRRCQQGDMDALEALVERYQADALRLAYLLTSDRALAEDIAQDGFLQAYRAIRQFDAQRPFAPWLFRIVANIARQRLRTRRRLREISLDVALGQSDARPGISDAEVAQALRTADPHGLDAVDPATQVEHAEERSAILQALDLLTYKQREAIILRYYLGFNDHECAAVAGCREGAFRVRLHGALRALKRVIHQRYPWLLPAHSSSADTWEASRHVAVE